MFTFICPICRKPLYENGGSYCCAGRHCFDRAKSGYINLLQSNQSAKKHHGDDKLMVNARKDFFQGEFYDPLISAVSALANTLTPENGVILDAGCGECTYTNAAERLAGKRGVTVAGVDISKDAVAIGAKRNPRLRLAVAGVFNLPVADNSINTVLNIFAPNADSEFLRILKCGGTMIRVIPDIDHLFELKTAVYAHPIKNDIIERDIPGFMLKEERPLTFSVTLPSTDAVQNLFCMTPYYYKTGKDDQLKLKQIDRLTVTAAFLIRVYRKVP